MKFSIGLISILLLLVCCEKPFSNRTKTVLAIPAKAMVTSTSVVFIAGYDEGENHYYGNAKAYFEEKDMMVVDSLYSISEIITWLNQNSAPEMRYDQIHIVSHSNPWLGMATTTIPNGERVSVTSLQTTKNENRIPILKNGIHSDTKLIFHTCGLGQNTPLLQALKDTFSNTESPTVHASSYFNVFGGKYAAHYLARPFYSFYPTAESPGPAALSGDFKEMYGSAAINWRKAMQNRRETSFGEAYSYKFNIPIDWEFTFNDDDVPRLKDRDAIMDWVSQSPEMTAALYQFNIPLEKYRWRSKTHGNTLYIQGKTTVLCVLEPVLDRNNVNEYKKAMVRDTTIYQIL